MSATPDILVIDDSPADLQLLTQVLREAGYQPRIAQSGQVALQSVQMRSPDLILLDVRLPDMDGYTICQEIQAACQQGSIPVIFISALDQSFSKVKAFQVGGIDYMTKPYETEEVLARVQLHLRNQRLQHRIEQHNQQLVAQEERWQLLLQGTGDGIFDWNIQAGNLFVSKQWQRMLGYVAASCIISYEFWENLIHPEDCDRTLYCLNAYLRHEIPTYNVELRLRCQDGSYLWVWARGQATWDKDGNPLRMVGVHQDISDRKQAEFALKTSEATNRAIFQALPDTVIHMNQDGTCLSIKPTQAFPMVVSDKEFDQSLLTSFFTAEDHLRLKALIQKVLSDRRLKIYEFEHDYQGLVQVQEARIVPLTSGEVLVLLRDISDRKQAESQMQKALAEKEILLQEIHHRIKNNLQLIQSLLQMQQRRITHPEAVQALQESQDRLASITLAHTLLYQSDEVGEIDLGTYLLSILQYIASFRPPGQDSPKLDTKLTSISVPIKTAISCGLILNELVTNALKYAFPEPSSPHQVHCIYVTLERPSDTNIPLARITVRDNGIGLPDTFDLDTVQSLGLMIVQALTEQLDGTLAIAPPPGTQFQITFPLVPAS